MGLTDHSLVYLLPQDPAPSFPSLDTPPGHNGPNGLLSFIVWHISSWPSAFLFHLRLCLSVPDLSEPQFPPPVKDGGCHPWKV